MLAQLVRSFFPSPEKLRAHARYLELVEKARAPAFYTEYGVPDTLDGRFEMILLHLFLELQWIRQQPGTQKFQQLLMETFFEDMDRSVRELGVSDTGVGKRVLSMADAFAGRMHAYEAGLADDDAMKTALRHNVYGTVDVGAEILDKMVAYLRNALR